MAGAAAGRDGGFLKRRGASTRRGAQQPLASTYPTGCDTAVNVCGLRKPFTALMRLQRCCAKHGRSVRTVRAQTAFKPPRGQLRHQHTNGRTNGGEKQVCHTREMLGLDAPEISSRRATGMFSGFAVADPIRRTWRGSMEGGRQNSGSSVNTMHARNLACRLHRLCACLVWQGWRRTPRGGLSREATTVEGAKQTIG